MKFTFRIEIYNWIGSQSVGISIKKNYEEIFYVKFEDMEWEKWYDISKDISDLSYFNDDIETRYVQSDLVIISLEYTLEIAK